VKKFLIAAVIVLAAFSLVTCGSNSNNSSRLTRAGYVAKANQLCKAANSEGNALKVKNKGKVEEEIKAAVGLLDNLQSDLSKLRPPSQMEADVNAWLATGDEAVSTFKTFAKEAAALDLNKDPLAVLIAPSYTKLASVNKTYNAQAKKLGLTECLSQGN
jgi:hypothetical protein